jgi:hypothetical protein
MMPPVANMNVHIRIPPMRRDQRRPHVSTQRRAGMVSTTSIQGELTDDIKTSYPNVLITNWIDEESSKLFPVSPAMLKTYVICR